MNSTKIKLCGLSRLEDIKEANRLKPDYIGFVFWEKSRRNVPFDKAWELKMALLPGIKAVGVFVDEAPERIAGLLKEGTIDAAQLHGHEDEEYIKRLRKLAPGKPIIKAFVIRNKEDLEAAEKSSADLLLLDSGTGTGKAFDHELLKEAAITKPYFLAGGLGPDNVGKAIDVLSPFGVDVSSGIETEGVKDPVKMKQFTDAVRCAGNDTDEKR
ncbi:MAG: phosphoribosylanthranilate isomerase [Butyrivibrio sp.]|nr:phosphoribosylanthranilate isomerase [Butyrivibrio sp.]